MMEPPMTINIMITPTYCSTRTSSLVWLLGGVRCRPALPVSAYVLQDHPSQKLNASAQRSLYGHCANTLCRSTQVCPFYLQPSSTPYYAAIRPSCVAISVCV